MGSQGNGAPVLNLGGWGRRPLVPMDILRQYGLPIVFALLVLFMIAELVRHRRL